MAKIWQEFYCNDCSTYIMVKINIALNHSVEVVCPMCQHHHPRHVKDGLIYDGRGEGSYVEEIHPPKSACGKEPRAKGMYANARNGVEIKSDADLVRDAYFRERWIEIYGGN